MPHGQNSSWAIRGQYLIRVSLCMCGNKLLCVGPGGAWKQAIGIVEASTLAKDPGQGMHEGGLLERYKSVCDTISH